MLSVNPVSFGAKIHRQTRNYFNKSQVEYTKDQFIKSYDSQIEKLQKQKEFAIKLDNMMFNDPEITEIIEAFPEDADVELAANLSVDGTDNGYSICLGNPMIMVENEEHFVKYDENGPDRQEIADWLKGINLTDTDE